LMYMEAKMKKVERLSSGESTMVITRDGQSSILTQRVPRKLPLDTTKSGATISTDYSTLDQDSQ
jgi:hypothetical protein